MASKIVRQDNKSFSLLTMFGPVHRRIVILLFSNMGTVGGRHQQNYFGRVLFRDMNRIGRLWQERRWSNGMTTMGIDTIISNSERVMISLRCGIPLDRKRRSVV